MRGYFFFRGRKIASIGNYPCSLNELHFCHHCLLWIWGKILRRTSLTITLNVRTVNVILLMFITVVRGSGWGYINSPSHNQNWIYDFLSSDWLTENQNIAETAKGLRPRGMAAMSRPKPLQRYSWYEESFRYIDLSTFRTCGKFHQKDVFFIFLYWNYMTQRSSGTISFNQRPWLRLLRTM